MHSVDKEKSMQGKDRGHKCETTHQEVSSGKIFIILKGSFSF